MKYRETSISRVFNIVFQHEEDVLSSLKDFCKEKSIKNAIIFLIGALKSAEIVVGPEKCRTPPNPVKKQFDDCREIIAIGTVVDEEIHVHASIGRKDSVFTGCVRDKTKTYLLLEGILFEFSGSIKKEIDNNLGVKIPFFD